MIITKIIGGLGNQMFQYAAGRRLAHKLDVELKLDISAFDNYKLRAYGLSVFNIKEKFATAEEIEKLSGRKVGAIETVWSVIFNRPKTYFRNLQPWFDPRILKLHDNIFLEGYWQSEKYFSDISEIIRQDFTIRAPQTGKNKELAQLIEQSNSVSLHIRRDDYLQKANKRFVNCDLHYYINSLNYLTKELQKPHFFVFSDDIPWAKDNLKGYPLTFVDINNESTNHEDLRLMSQCKHHIIANSSFSWWGAWLNPKKDKMVLAPKKWFKNPLYNRDIIPTNWLKI